MARRTISRRAVPNNGRPLAIYETIIRISQYLIVLRCLTVAEATDRKRIPRSTREALLLGT